ncbi:murein hydrolase activator EnvC family protein [Actinomadura roseirufa]|uniref:murein hydrolase activator EnvC family protein n=1 Tax=Actinomadura roseirufa TaxID=2094049 RepID=UPI001A955303|nr:M23 family metallopeptidase [Actinomadura roseirufa]
MTLLTCLLACMISTGAPGPGAWRWPLGPPAPKVVRAFSPPAVPWGAGHRGVDLAARPRQRVLAAGPGRVSYAGRLAGRGIVAVDHGVVRTTYLPVRPSVQVGRKVSAGTPLGILESGLNHCMTPCLHWGLIQGRTYLDPLTLVTRKVRLLPYWETPASPPRGEHHQAPQEPNMVLRDATSATGGALTGVVVAYGLAFAWRRRRRRLRSRRPPPGVIDLTRERRLRRTP